MEDKCTKFISLSVSRSGQISGPGVPLSVAARIGEDAERAERNFRYGGPVFRTFRKTMVLQDAARAGSTDRRSERMQKALVDFAAQGGEMLIKFGLSLTFPHL
ncbi:hypothetical protein ALIPUT_02194 [Alistipes putredinis DSM 17216]|jgi:hypothetical protein|uniref:Uncharacterized protein n=1 Tax=Alistipes putredinis DSM 17216 TaxID=445970 RepID=B0MY75_9BACT|nr:hypothetical protein ALIPUT_02194 [Alistipes putredinis DSM 17216]